ncbi:hypothetical protein [Hymenobacter volaticus]|uniref:MBL fold metallo-hydrolase n=1 Tax=Hymenobacter volaticus TaxID=2932254 RepID=A0ABY4GFY6_9BACT|nr:hypothetical protein [Hymenobacter volaticus]UOQ69883.1 hypothetical protein MUN86_30745 [Hymenobacter volaticus]
MHFAIDVLSLDKADASIIWARDHTRDYVVFLDAGKKGDAKLILDHFNACIKGALQPLPYIIAVNTHMHSDHLGGMEHLVTQLHQQGNQVEAVYFNNPIGPCGSRVLLEKVRDKTRYIFKNSQLWERAQFLAESLKQASSLDKQLQQLGIAHRNAFAGTTLLPKPYQVYLRILGPTPTFYKQMMEAAGRDIARGPLLKILLAETEAGADPCRAIAKYKDPSHDNKASVVLELLTEQGNKCLFTADASEPSFESIEHGGHQLSLYQLVQLPHHGSRYNLNAARMQKFEANRFWVAASNDGMHPGSDLLECLKQTVPGCVIYSTGDLPRGSCQRFVTDSLTFLPCTSAQQVVLS